MSNPFDAMSAQERDEWVDIIGNSGIGESMALQQISGCEEEHIEKLMHDNDYARCVRCDNYTCLSEIRQVDAEEVCDDCLEPGEEEDE